MHTRVRHMAEKSEADDLDKPCQHFQTEEVPYLMCFKANGVPSMDLDFLQLLVFCII
jgi:hypothetical protein